MVNQQKGVQQENFASGDFLNFRLLHRMSFNSILVLI